MTDQDAVSRIREIMSHPHASGRQAFAQHLALHTTMTAAQAIEALRLAGGESWNTVVQRVNQRARLG